MLSAEGRTRPGNARGYLQRSVTPKIDNQPGGQDDETRTVKNTRSAVFGADQRSILYDASRNAHNMLARTGKSERYYDHRQPSFGQPTSARVKNNWVNEDHSEDAVESRNAAASVKVSRAMRENKSAKQLQDRNNYSTLSAD